MINLSVQERRERVFALIDEVAEVAANELIETLQYRPVDALDLAAKKLRNDTASEILDLAGYKVKRVEHSGSVKFEPLSVSRESELLNAAREDCSVLKIAR